MLFPKSLLILGSRVRSWSSSCSQHNSRQCLLTGTYWPQLALDSARRNVKYPQKASGEGSSAGAAAAGTRLPFEVLLLPTQSPQKSEDVESQDH